jgi:septal ring-binding cell division protein DamX
MVQTIRSNTSTGVAVMDAPQPSSIPKPLMAIPDQTDVQETNEAVVQGTVRSATPVGEPDLVGLDPLAGLDRDPFDVDELFEDVFAGSFAPAEWPRHSSESSRETILQVSPPIPEPVHEPAPQPESTPSASTELADGPPEMAAVTDAAPASPAELNDIDSESDSRIDCATDGPTVQPLLRHEVVTDPLEDPGQNWAYSQDDYPLVVPRVGLSNAARLKLSLAALFVVCSVTAGYFLIYRQSIQAAQSKQANAQQSSAAPVHGGSAVANAIPAGAEPGSEASESQDLRTSEDKLDGRYSLQAAAFPNEAGANEFCERLKRAGVPAYVVSAEIAGRGRWFRVRVGKFETTQEADRFAAESRRRARAAGLNLQLIVSGYDKP